MSEVTGNSRPLKSFGVLVRETRLQRGLTQQRAAKGAGVSRKQWALLERGENVSAVFIQKVAAHLGLRVIPLGPGVEATIETGGIDVQALFQLADDLIALTTVIADRLRAFALEAVLPPSERGQDSSAIASLLERAEDITGDPANRLNRVIHDLTTHVPSPAIAPVNPAQHPKGRKRRA